MSREINNTFYKELLLRILSANGDKIRIPYYKVLSGKGIGSNESYCVEIQEESFSGDRLVVLKRLPKMKLECTCGEVPHRISCPLGFDNYFHDIDENPELLKVKDD